MAEGEFVWIQSVLPGFPEPLPLPAKPAKPGKFQNWDQVWKSHGLGEGDWRFLHDQQGGVCFLCRKKIPAFPGKNSHTDHDHRKRESLPWARRRESVRGLLCRGCNARLGWIEKNKIDLAAVARYLKEGWGETQALLDFHDRMSSGGGRGAGGSGEV